MPSARALAFFKRSIYIGPQALGRFGTADSYHILSMSSHGELQALTLHRSPCKSCLSHLQDPSATLPPFPIFKKEPQEEQNLSLPPKTIYNLSTPSPTQKVPKTQY